MKTKILCASIFLAGLPFAAAFADAPAIIEGSVKDGVSGTPLSGAVVSIVQSVGKDRLGAPVGEIKYQEIVKSDGTFSIGGVDPGTYSATVTYPGYKPVGKAGIATSSGQTTPLDVQLGRY